MTTERAVLAGGCFWGMQDLTRRLPGVISTRVGYTGGDVDNATYRNHGTHAEAIEITFDPHKTSFRDLLAEQLATNPAAPGVADEEVAGIDVDLDATINPAAYLTHVGEVFERLERLRD